MLPNPNGGTYGPTSGSPNLYPPGTEHLRPDNVEWPSRDPVVKKGEAEATASVSSLLFRAPFSRTTLQSYQHMFGMCVKFVR